MPALIGRYDYALDDKNRLVAPPRYRDALSREGGRHFILSLGLERCLYLFLPSQWERVVAEDRDIFGLKDKRQVRVLKRLIFSYAMESEPDEQGRILVPQHLKDHAGLSKEVVILGMGNKAEIWSRRALERIEKAGLGLMHRMSSRIDL